MRVSGTALFGLALVAAAAARAEAPKLELPVDCEFARDCMIQKFFDHDPGSDYRDYACGTLASDGHQGTDFRVPDLPAMRRGVAVVAAASGTVKWIPDGMQDIDVREIGSATLEGRSAGNAVVVAHGDGWEI